MGRQIGEVFEHNGEWYQCVKGDICADCAFVKKHCNENPLFEAIGSCSKFYRKDATSVIFKKLEKVREPYDDCGTILQRFRIHTNVTNVDTKGLELHIYSNNTIGIEIKQTKEDMEEYKMYDAKEDIPEFDKVVDECLFGEDKLKLKPFNLQKAREGKPVYTRDGRKVRIICFDREFIHKGKNYCIVALINDGSHGESLYSYTEDGLFSSNKIHNSDLMMLPEKKEGWINICRNLNTNKTELDTKDIYNTKEEALQNLSSMTYVTTVKIEWEE